MRRATVWNVKSFALAIAVTPAVCWANDGVPPQNQCSAEQADFANISERYKAVFDGYQKEGAALKGDTATFKTDVTWADAEITYYTPSVAINDQRFEFKVPQVTVKMNEFVFEKPTVHTERVRVGQHPNFYCDTNTAVPKCTTLWNDIYSNTATTIVETQRAEYPTLTLKWDHTQITVEVPELFMRRQGIVLGVPQFKGTDFDLSSESLKEKSAALQRRAADARSNLLKETADSIHSLYACYRGHLKEQRQFIAAQFEPAADQTKISNDSGTFVDLRRIEVIDERDKTMAAFDARAVLSKLDADEKDAVEKKGHA
jgi:hypothetical protein